MPALAVKLLFGEMGERLLLRGQQVIPKRLQQAGFDFTYPTLDKALEQIVVR
jgi:NAD dependent epimerase/dehydratase family enzyme